MCRHALAPIGDGLDKPLSLSGLSFPVATMQEEMLFSKIPGILSGCHCKGWNAPEAQMRVGCFFEQASSRQKEEKGGSRKVRGLRPFLKS